MNTFYQIMRVLCWMLFWFMVGFTLNSVYTLVVTGYVVWDAPAIIAVAGIIGIMYVLVKCMLVCIKGFLDILERLWGKD